MSLLLLQVVGKQERHDKEGVMVCVNFMVVELHLDTMFDKEMVHLNLMETCMKMLVISVQAYVR